MEMLEGIMSRRSVRAYDADRAVEPEKVRAIVAAGMNAPTAMEQYAWRMMTVENRDTLTKMSEYNKWWKMLPACPLGIVILTDPSVRDDLDEEYQIISGACAAENMLLAAHGLGLGGVYLGMCKADAKYEAFTQMLHVPAPLRVMGVLAIGYPKAEAKPREDTFDESKWMKEHF